MPGSRRPSRPRVEPIAPIIVGCVSTVAAAALARSLRNDAELNTIIVDGTNVKVPGSGSETFLRELFTRSLANGWVTPEIAASAVHCRMREMARRARS